jgi:hypothetical protein
LHFTEARLRQAFVQPAAFVTASRMPPAVNFGNPQRQWLEAAIKAYFAADRDGEIAWATLQEKAAARSEMRYFEGFLNGAENLLEQFLAFDAAEQAIPRGTLFARSRRVPFGRHTLSMQRHLLYLSPGGYELRQIWTARDLDIDHDLAPLMALASLVCAEFDLGRERVESVDVWQLRSEGRQRWRRNALTTVENELREYLDTIEEEVLR